MTEWEAIALHTKWKQRGDQLPCEHLDQEVDCSEDGIVKTCHCLTCGKEMLRVVYKDFPFSSNAK
jgi:hypothetical protein